MSRFFFLAGAFLITITYYIGASRMIKDTEKFNQGIQSAIYALTGRTSEGQFADEWRDYPSGNVHVTEEEEEETIYYLPPGLPKEEKDVVYG